MTNSDNSQLSTDNYARLEAIVSGNVQGVAFRYFTQMKATELGVVGWCMNKRDGTVFVLAEAEKAQLDQLLAWLYEGSPSSRVRDVKAIWSDASGEFKRFTVKRTFST